MNIFDDFDLILAHFNKKEEPLFLRDVKEFAEKNKDAVIKSFSVLLKNKGLNIQLKYLILKSIGELKYIEFVPMVKEALHQETKIQLIYEAVNSLTAIGSFSCYKVIVDFFIKHKKAEYAEKIEKNLREVFIKNPLAFHFDVFYRNRGNVANIERSSELLIRKLPDEYITEILPCLTSSFQKIKYETLRILKHRPKAVYYANIYQVFNESFNQIDEELFLIMSEALVINASVSKAKDRIFQKLKEVVQKLDGDKKTIFCIVLLKMSNRELIHYIEAVYPQLNYERKMLVFKNLDPNEYVYYMDFIRELLVNENNEDLLAEVVDILIHAHEFKYLFDTVDTENGLRKSKLLTMILERRPKEIEHFIQNYVNPKQDNQILLLALEYLLKNAANKYFDLIKPIFFSGVSPEIKTLIIRNVNKWNALNQRAFMESIFKDLNIIAPLKKDFLFSLLGLLNEKLFDEAYEAKILNHILVLMEETPGDEIVNFIYFFDKYQVNSVRDRDLIIEELRMIQNSLLKSNSDQNLVRMIHILIKNLEKKVRPKK